VPRRGWPNTSPTPIRPPAKLPKPWSLSANRHKKPDEHRQAHKIPVETTFETFPKGEPYMTPLQSLIATGTKLWLDSIDPDLVARNRALGATGATSNPIIVSDLIKTGRFDEALTRFMRESKDDDPVAWKLTDMLVKQAQDVFLPVWEKTKGDDG